MLPAQEGRYRLTNGQGTSATAYLVLVVDGEMGRWGEFGACSKTCTFDGQPSGGRLERG